MIICLRMRAQCLVIRTRDPIKEDGAYCPHLPSVFFSSPPSSVRWHPILIQACLLIHLPLVKATFPSLHSCLQTFFFFIYPFSAAPCSSSPSFFLSADPKNAPSAHWAKAAPCAALHDRGRPKRGADPMIRIDRVSERRLSKCLQSGQPWCGIDGM